MKKIPLFLFAFLLLGFQQTMANHPTDPEENDKEFLLSYYQRNMDNLRAKTADLSVEQLNFQPSDESWSIIMCLEHIYLTEQSLIEMVHEVLEQPANPDERESLVATDDEMLNTIVDRSARFKAPEVLHPTGLFDSAEQAIEAISDNRTRIFELIESHSIDEMRSRVADAPFGKIDGYQYLLFIAGHAERHSLQIDEIMASEEFPR
jgi:hypothetical protein